MHTTNYFSSAPGNFSADVVGFVGRGSSWGRNEEYNHA
jgi:hypothetical protein